MAYNKRQKLEDNIEAIRLSFEIEREGRKATVQEREALRKYSGFGGLKFILNDVDNPGSWTQADRPLQPRVKELFDIIRRNSRDDKEYTRYIQSVRNSILSAFYTPQPVIDALSASLGKAGVEVRNFLDPSSGRGSFVEAFRNGRPDMEVTAYEKDLLTGKVLKALYPGDDIHVEGYETSGGKLRNRFDVAASNIPFGDISVFDPAFTGSQNEAYRLAGKTIHNYFFLKTLDNVRDGGLVAFITSQGVMDSPRNKPVREAMMQQAYLVGAVRLPNNLFTDEAGTDVGSDLIVLQKDSRKPSTFTDSSPEERAFIDNLNDFKGKDHTLEALDFSLGEAEAWRAANPNAYIFLSEYVWDSESPYIGVHSFGKDQYGKPAVVTRWDGTVEEMAKVLQDRLDGFMKYEFNRQLYRENMTVKDIVSNTVRTVPKQAAKAQVASAPVQLDLFSFWGEQENGTDRMKPRGYMGFVREYYHNGTVIDDGGQLGVLSGIDASPVFTPLDINEGQTAVLRQYVKVRDSYEELYRTEAEDRKEHPGLRWALNREYDVFVSKYGYLNDRKNQKVIIMDVSGRDSLSLEYSDGDGFVKADIFNCPVSFDTAKVQHVGNAVDALSSSLNRTGGVDLEYMASVSDISVSDLKEQLRGRIFFNPLSDGYEVADKFLSGNVVEKYDSLKAWTGGNEEQAEEICRSLEALGKVIPAPVTYDELDFNFGERWMPAEYFSEFASNLFDTDIRIEYIPQLDEFVIDPQEPVYNNVKITDEYAVATEAGKTVDGIELLRHALYNTVPNIQRVIGYRPNGDPINGPDHEKMQLAASKIDDIRDRFTQWINGHEQTWKEDLAEMYNRKYNCFVRARYDGSHQTFPGLDMKSLKEKKDVSSIYASQKDAIWMLLQNGGGICDHEVGTGKTLIMCIAAHEMKRLGMAHKPVIIGMKANVSEIAATYQSAYPGDRILYATPKDFTDRQAFFNRMKNNDYDCIIMSHDQFAMIPQSTDIQKQVMCEELEALEQALEVYGRTHNVGGRLLKGLEKRKENLMTSLAELNHKLATRADDVVDFKTMGIDHIFVDESQAFKNLAYTTRDSRVAGLGDPAGSQRARNMQYAIRTIQERTGRDLGATFLSGTTISNSLTELYLLFKYLRPQALSGQDINSFDAWAAVFAKKSRDYEINVAGQVVMKERFRNFIKVPELASFYNEITDYKTAADVGLERPQMNVRLVNIPPTPDHQDFSKRLLDFANTGDGEHIFRGELSDSEKQAKMLIVTGLGKKASLSPRLVNPDYHEGDDTKIGYAAKNISEYYRRYDAQKGTQFVFCDLSTPKKGEWNAYQELKDRLVSKYGIPENEIQFMQDATTEKKRKEFIARMNSGDIRVLFGSTTTLGTGVNAQQRAVAVHHLDLPWRPSDMEQRNGRAVRKGNEVARQAADNKVDVLVYAVERSLDSYNFYLLQAKQEFIRQMKTGALGKRSFDQGGEDETNGMPFAEYVAITSGNTDLLERAKLEKRILGLESERKAFNSQQRNVSVRLDNAVKDLDRNKDILGNLRKDLARFEKTAERDGMGNYVNTLDVGPGIVTPEEKGRFLQDNARRLITEEVQVGTIYGFPVLMRPQTAEERSSKTSTYQGNIFFVKGAYSYRHNEGRVNLASRREAAMNPFEAITRLPRLEEEYERRVLALEKEIPELRLVAGKEWNKSGQLAEMKRQLEELDRKIQQSMDESIIKAGGKGSEELPFKITQRSYGREPWQLEYKVSDYPYVTRKELDEVADRYHGSLRVYKGVGDGSFRHRVGAESAMMEITRLNTSRKDNVEWLKEAVRNIYDNACTYAYARLKEMGLDRYGRALHEKHPHLKAVALGDYADVRALAHGVKDGNPVALEVAAKAISRVILAMPESRNAVLVPMPGHDGNRGGMARLARMVSELSGVGYSPDYLMASSHDSLYTWKKEHPDKALPELLMAEGSDVPQGKKPILLDNVLDTGHTAWAALEAMSQEPVMVVVGATGNHERFGRDITLSVDAGSRDYIRNVTPPGVGFTGKTRQELAALMRNFRSSDWAVSYDAKKVLGKMGIDGYTGQPAYEVAAIASKWENVFDRDALREKVSGIVSAGGFDRIFSEEERRFLSADDRRQVNSLLKEFEGIAPGNLVNDSSLARCLIINCEYLHEKARTEMAKSVAACQDKGEGCVENVCVFTPKDGEMNIRCRIDGRQMLSKRLSSEDAKAYSEGKIGKDALAVKYFARELENDREKKNVMKR